MSSPSTGAGRVFEIPELLHFILDLVAPGSSECPGGRPQMPDVVARRSLAVLARTCRALSEPCLDILWRRLDSLKPLIQCYSGNVGTQTMIPSLTECQVVGRYSPRIRDLEVSDGDTLQFLEIMSLGQFSLPNLRLLKWDVKDRDDSDTFKIIHTEPLLSVSLVTLDAHIKGTNSALVLSFLRNYPVLCPNLRSVKLDLTNAMSVKKNFNTLICALSTAVTKHKNLECLELSNPTTKPALEELLMFQSLKALSLLGRVGCDDMFLEDVSISSTDIPLRNVTDLHLSLSHLHVITDLLRPHHQPFRKIHFHVHGPPMQSAMQDFTFALATRQREESLQSIVLDHLHGRPGGAFGCSGVFEAIGHHFCLWFDAFRPLVSLGHLRELVIHLFDGISLDDNELAMLANSWPLLEVLRLDPLVYRWGAWKDAKSITLAGLLPLLASCPKLQNLQLPLDAREVPKTTSQAGPCNTAIKSLCLSGRPISDPDRVTRFLRTYLPSISSVVRPHSYDDYDDLWEQVETNLRAE